MIDGTGGTVLILEDDAGVARLQQRRLERAGYATLVAGTAAEALAHVERGGVELLLVDYRLPGGADGLDFYALLKGRGYDLPAILVTGFSDDATAIRALRAGVRDFVTKSPEYLDYLPEATGRVLKQVRTERQLAESERALRRNNEALAKALAELEAKNEELKATTQQLWQAAKLASVGELAASIAHELNNPLATVSLRVESVLARTPADDPRRRPLEVIEQEARRMGDLVANLLQFCRRGREEVSTVDVGQELTRAVELVQHLLRKRLIRVTLGLHPDTPAIFADRQKLRQVFLNLLTNATDAMPQGGNLSLRTGPTTLEGGRAGVLLEFADTGVGIPPEHLGKITEPFFTTKEEGKGTGLGLAICRRIVQEHRGVLHVASEVGKGTTVSVRLPAKNGSNVEGLRRGGPAG